MDGETSHETASAAVNSGTKAERMTIRDYLDIVFDVSFVNCKLCIADEGVCRAGVKSVSFEVVCCLWCS